ncbi:helix-turn-helix transcriptional regulator [Bacillus sp. 3255]|uniref:helix-turn-helix domain-containing protein n=1 Tax=Bacillus sp. 3255 TaxID=2817904 RepID=UPI002857E4B4|nr:helix-turn-helix transcriptional regulator [Bacillus sp. 3255]MDR6883567.1 putative transcriptional regulator [Bacillus sp. 3255]
MKLSPESFRMIRVVYGLTQQEYADLLDCSVSTVSKIEKGYRSLTHGIERKVLDEMELTEDKLARIHSLYREICEGVAIKLVY